jgi:large subunit ribosomal protein L10
MPTQRKIELVEEYAQKFKDSNSIFLADYSGINVENTNELRRAFRAADVEYRILKNTLAIRSFQDAGIDGLEETLKGMTSFAFSGGDPVAPIKVIKDFNKKQRKGDGTIVVKGCVFEGQVFNADQAEALSNLPTREVLLSQLVGMLQSPLSKLMGTLQSAGQKLVGTLEEIKNQKSQ